MSKVLVFDVTGKKKEAVSLPKELFAENNLPILAQAVRVFENRSHEGLARVKSRGEIVSSKRKIYKQKGTGGARHGARSAPIFVGGGVAHGPTGNRRVLSMPLKMRARALQIALGLKAKEGKLVVVDGLLKLEKAKDAQKLIVSITEAQNVKRNARFLVALSEKNLRSLRYLRNLNNVEVVQYRNLNAYSVFLGGTVIVDADALTEMPKKVAKKSEKVEKSVAGDSKKKVAAKPVVKKVAKKKVVKK